LGAVRATGDSALRSAGHLYRPVCPVVTIGHSSLRSIPDDNGPQRPMVKTICKFHQLRLGHLPETGPGHVRLSNLSAFSLLLVADQLGKH
jgi:hypothetical protein